MAYPTISIKDGSGSDSAASGAGPAIALSGTSASYTGSVFTLDGSPDLSGVATDGSHAIWVDTSTARKFFTINAVNDGADTVTTDDAPAGTSTGLTWGIGGKRASLFGSNSIELLENGGAAGDALAGWIIEMESGHTESFSTGSTIKRDGGLTNGPITVRGALDAATPPVLTNTGTDVWFFMEADGWNFREFECECTNGTPATVFASTDHGSVQGYAITKVHAKHSTNKVKAFISTVGDGTWWLWECEIGHCTTNGINGSDGGFRLKMQGCYVHDCTIDGFVLNDGIDCDIFDSIFANNGGDGITAAATRTINIIKNCLIYGNTGDGINIPRAQIIINTISANNTGVGIKYTDTEKLQESRLCKIVNCCTNGNSSHFSGVSSLIREDNVTTSPGFTNAGSQDWTIGTNLKELGFPLVTYPGTATRSYVDIGAAQRSESAAGGTPPFFVRSSNSLLTR